ncbi:hypothetical protein QBC39DRAFT_153894 [Podospora conica]|nr:hypothetical protein QBC39DRAFT_153894 [Schizothecium conicum]
MIPQPYPRRHDDETPFFLLVVPLARRYRSDYPPTLFTLFYFCHSFGGKHRKGEGRGEKLFGVFYCFFLSSPTLLPTTQARCSWAGLGCVFVFPIPRSISAWKDRATRGGRNERIESNELWRHAMFVWSAECEMSVDWADEMSCFSQPSPRFVGTCGAGVVVEGKGGDTSAKQKRWRENPPFRAFLQGLGNRGWGGTSAGFQPPAVLAEM